MTRTLAPNVIGQGSEEGMCQRAGQRRWTEDGKQGRLNFRSTCGRVLQRALFEGNVTRATAALNVV